MRVAVAEVIRSIDFTRSGIAGTGSLSPRARRALSVYVVLVKMGYEALSAPMGAIADAVHRATNGESGSIRTLQRAHTELKQAGYIRTQNFRAGDLASCSMIFFNVESFAYFTQRKQNNVSPLPTRSHNVVSRETMCDSLPHTTDCRGLDLTNKKIPDNPKNLPRVKKEPRAGARSINNKSKRARRSAVWTTVNIVLGSLRELHSRDRKAARARARCEMDSLRGGVELLNPSGVDWEYWEKRFAEMTIPVREATARNEIIPLLLGKSFFTSEPAPSAKSSPAQATPEPSSVLEAADIQAARLLLEQKFSLPKRAAGPEASVCNTAESPMNYDGMDILIAARDRAKRRVNGV